MHLSKISLALRQWGAGAGFSPLDLFSSGEQGAWYDPSDINNYMGPELIVNGTFDSNTDGWTPIDATASVVGGKCVVTNTSNTWGLVTTELQVTVGDIYALSIYFDTTSGYGAAVAIPGLFEDGISAGQTITYSATVVADTNPLTLYIGNADEVVGHNISFDNVSIRRIGEATMFQDNAGTTPVTADGQPVGKILDKSGRGNHASQATAASRPLYKTDGTYHWLQFDGVDDSLSTAAINFTSTSQMSVFSGSLYTNNSMSVAVELNNMNSGESFGLFTPETATTIQFGIHGSGGYELEVITGSFANSKFVLSSLANRVAVSGNLIAMRMDGVPAGTTTRADPITEAFGNYPLYVGGRENTSLYLNGNIYSLIVRGALSTADEITATETWVNSKTGAY